MYEEVCGVALSKYQFETAAAIGMRHAFHRPLRPAFHFYLYLSGRSSPVYLTAGLRIPMSPSHPRRKGTSRRRWRRSALSIFYDILFPIRGEKALGHLGPYSAFMAISRDEVSRE